MQINEFINGTLIIDGKLVVTENESISNIKKLLAEAEKHNEPLVFELSAISKHFGLPVSFRRHLKSMPIGNSFGYNDAQITKLSENLAIGLLEQIHYQYNDLRQGRRHQVLKPISERLTPFLEDRQIAELEEEEELLNC